MERCEWGVEETPRNSERRKSPSQTRSPSRSSSRAGVQRGTRNRTKGTNGSVPHPLRRSRRTVDRRRCTCLLPFTPSLSPSPRGIRCVGPRECVLSCLWALQGSGRVDGGVLGPTPGLSRVEDVSTGACWAPPRTSCLPSCGGRGSHKESVPRRTGTSEASRSPNLGSGRRRNVHGTPDFPPFAQLLFASETSGRLRTGTPPLWSSTKARAGRRVSATLEPIY